MELSRYIVFLCGWRVRRLYSDLNHFILPIGRLFWGLPHSRTLPSGPQSAPNRAQTPVYFPLSQRKQRCCTTWDLIQTERDIGGPCIWIDHVTRTMPGALIISTSHVWVGQVTQLCHTYESILSKIWYWVCWQKSGYSRELATAELWCFNYWMSGVLMIVTCNTWMSGGLMIFRSQIWVSYVMRI